jgi:hypothetical protein
MKTTLTILLALYSASASAAITRNINGADYFLNSDLDTMDGECVLRGYEYTTSMNSELIPCINVARLHADGTFRDVVISNKVTCRVIESLQCGPYKPTI